MRLKIIGDGPRDEGVLKCLVDTLLGRSVEAGFRDWHRIRLRRPSYGNKLKLELLNARADGHDGVVAVVDADREPRRARLRELATAREEHRIAHGPLPAALGEARPHVEVWLLDDEKAVRAGLSLPGDHRVAWNERDGKGALNEIIAACADAGRVVDHLPLIAREVRLERCNHRESTGFGDFAADIELEFGTQPQRSAA